MTRADPFGTLCDIVDTRLAGRPATPALAAAVANPRQPWPRLARLSGVHLLTPAVGAALEELGLAGSIPPDLSDYFAAMRSAGEERNGDLRADLFRIVAILNEAGVEPILLKGALRLVDGLFPDDSWRFMHDLDLLVPAAGVGRSTRALPVGLGDGGTGRRGRRGPPRARPEPARGLLATRAPRRAAGGRLAAPPGRRGSSGAR